MSLELFQSSKDFKQSYEEAVLLDFGAQRANLKELDPKKKLFFIGAEGGFSKQERKLFKEKISLNCPNILRSQSAALALASALLLYAQLKQRSLGY